MACLPPAQFPPSTTTAGPPVGRQFILRIPRRRGSFVTSYGRLCGAAPFRTSPYPSKTKLDTGPLFERILALLPAGRRRFYIKGLFFSCRYKSRAYKLAIFTSRLVLSARPAPYGKCTNSTLGPADPTNGAGDRKAEVEAVSPDARISILSRRATAVYTRPVPLQS